MTNTEELIEGGMMSVEEAIVFTGLSKSHLYVVMGRGELAFVKHGRRRLVPRNGVVKLLAGGLRGGEVQIVA